MKRQGVNIDIKNRDIEHLLNIKELESEPIRSRYGLKVFQSCFFSGLKSAQNWRKIAALNSSSILT